MCEQTKTLDFSKLQEATEDGERFLSVSARARLLESPWAAKSDMVTTPSSVQKLAQKFAGVGIAPPKSQAQKTLQFTPNKGKGLTGEARIPLSMISNIPLLSTVDDIHRSPVPGHSNAIAFVTESEKDKITETLENHEDPTECDDCVALQPKNVGSNEPKAGKEEVCSKEESTARDATEGEHLKDDETECLAVVSDILTAIENVEMMQEEKVVAESDTSSTCEAEERSNISLASDAVAQTTDATAREEESTVVDCVESSCCTAPDEIQVAIIVSDDQQQTEDCVEDRVVDGAEESEEHGDEQQAENCIEQQVVECAEQHSGEHVAGQETEQQLVERVVEQEISSPVEGALDGEMLSPSCNASVNTAPLGKEDMDASCSVVHKALTVVEVPRDEQDLADTTEFHANVQSDANSENADAHSEANTLSVAELNLAQEQSSGEATPILNSSIAQSAAELHRANLRNKEEAPGPFESSYSSTTRQSIESKRQSSSPVPSQWKDVVRSSVVSFCSDVQEENLVLQGRIEHLEAQLKATNKQLIEASTQISQCATKDQIDALQKLLVEAQDARQRRNASCRGCTIC
jgi:hypothetical protein